MPTGRMPAYVINTRITHAMGPLFSNDNNPRFAQLYLLDAEFNDGTDVRPGERRNLRTEQLQRYFQHAGSGRPSARAQQLLTAFLNELEVVLRQCNGYIRDLVTAAQAIQALPSEEQLGVRIVIDRDARPSTSAAVDGGRHHQRTYNPRELYGERAIRSDTFQEVALLTTPAGLGSDDFVLQPRSGGIQSISILHRAFDPLYFVLLFPYGDDGWRDHLYKVPVGTRATDEALADATLRRMGTRNRITASAFYAHRLHWRRGERYQGSRCVLMGGRLLQEYACTGYARNLLNQLNWVRHNQHTLRRDTYANLRTEVAEAAAAGRNVQQCGQPVILPQSFSGGPRDMKARYLDALAVVRELGKPTLFVTMTCNPKWPEIVDSLPHGSKAEDHPEIVARVFKIKLDDLMAGLTERHVLGVTIAHMMVVEFQFRGLPHAHILLVMQSADRILTADATDQVSVAELPPRSSDNRTQRRLRETVLEHMVHNDCSNDPRCQCRAQTGQCRWRYPKMYCDHTRWSDESLYPELRRREGTEYEANMNGRIIDSRWIAPYNPALLLKYNCHINVEVCASVEAVKYIYKVRCPHCPSSVLLLWLPECVSVGSEL